MANYYVCKAKYLQTVYACTIIVSVLISFYQLLSQSDWALNAAVWFPTRVRCNFSARLTKQLDDQHLARGARVYVLTSIGRWLIVSRRSGRSAMPFDPADGSKHLLRPLLIKAAAVFAVVISAVNVNQTVSISKYRAIPLWCNKRERNVYSGLTVYRKTAAVFTVVISIVSISRVVVSASRHWSI